VRRIEPPTLEDILAARWRIHSAVLRTPLVALDVDAPCKIFLKLETLQPIGSFKLRGAMSAIRLLSSDQMSRGVYTASAGNMAQGVAWGAREQGVPCVVVMPESAPQAKVDAVERLGARVVSVSYEQWWQTLIDHGRTGIEGTFIHPVADRAVIAGNGTIGLEIIEDLPDAAAVLVPFGGGGLATGIATSIRALAPKARVYGCEVETATPLTAALAAQAPVLVERRASFVDGIGGSGVLPEMWPLVSALLDGAIVSSLTEVSSALRLLVQRARIVAEGAGATSVAAALAGRAGAGKVVCVVSGGNIDLATLISLLRG
jgi:threonine dehydratase